MLREKSIEAANGLAMLPLLLAAEAVAVWGLVMAGRAHEAGIAVGWLIFGLLVFVLLLGFFMVEPNQGRVLTLFGSYRGTPRTPGLRWANPFYSKRAVSLRVRNF